MLTGPAHHTIPGSLRRSIWVLCFLMIVTGTAAQKSVVIDSVIITGNKITRDDIILRECLFSVGQRMERDSLKGVIRRSEENLVNTALFNFATITTSPVDGSENRVSVTIDVVERWYIWPVPIFQIADRNFNVWWETKDFSRISYGLFIEWNNLTGRMDNLRSKLQLGYDEEIGFEYSIPYLNRKKTLGAGISFDYQRNHEVAAASEENKHIFYKQDDDYVRQYFGVTLKAFIKQGHYNKHEFNVNYSLYRFNDSLIELYPWYTAGSDRDEFISLHYKYRSDHRDYHAYPLTGHYFDLEISKYGLSILNGKGPDFFSVGSAFRKYWKFNDILHYAFGVNAVFSNSGFQPYYLVKGIGYGRDIVRGYEYYVIDAGDYAIWKNNLKFKLFSKSDAQIPFIKSERFGRVFYGFYLNFFVDMGYADQNFFYSEDDILHNELLVGYGAGIDFTTYYDVVIRAEYSYNRLGESGIFIHFMASI